MPKHPNQPRPPLDPALREPLMVRALAWLVIALLLWLVGSIWHGVS